MRSKESMKEVTLRLLYACHLEIDLCCQNFEALILFGILELLTELIHFQSLFIQPLACLVPK